MIWLQSKQFFDRVAHFNPITGEYNLLSKKLQQNGNNIDTKGQYDFLSGAFFAVYKYGDNLILRVDKKTFCIDDDLVVNVKGDLSDRIVSIIYKHKEVLTLNYTLDGTVKFDNDPTPFVDNEDFDFGLFISNITKSKSRKNVLLGLE